MNEGGPKLAEVVLIPDGTDGLPILDHPSFAVIVKQQLLGLTLHPLGMPSSVLVRVLAYLLEGRPASTLDIRRVLLPVYPVILSHILRL
jgi:hypothetical protein